MSNDEDNLQEGETDEFPVGKTIWPGVSSRGGNADQRAVDAITRVMMQLAEYTADSLERRGLARFAFPLFRPFNAVFVLTQDAMFCVGSPLSGGIASLRFIDVRESFPPLGIEQLRADVQQQLGWREIFSFRVPGISLDASASTREKTLRAVAEDLAERIRSDVERASRKVQWHPVFRTSLAELETDESLCFVLMPFDARFDRLYRETLTPAIESSGLKPMRADQVFSPTPIVEEIWTRIATARLIVADVTNKNPNVFYELGLAHAIGKPVIVVTQNKADVPFDIAYIRYFEYADDAGGWGRLQTDLSKAIDAVIQGR